MLNESHLWVAEPHAAYLHWQTTEAAGADRRRFSQRSIVQHKAMFDRFLRHLVTRGAALATFGPEHLESFFDDVQNRCAPGTTTRLRYVKLIDRLCRHLVDVGLRHSNPAATFALSAAWPKDEPEPLFLDTDADTALQGYFQPDAGDDARLCRSEAHASRGLCPFPPSRRLRSRHGNGFIRRPTARFFSPRRAPDDKPINDVLLGAIVRDALDAIGFAAPDMSPRVLRNTFARRHLLSGRTNEQTSAMLGLASHLHHGTVGKAAQTIRGDVHHRLCSRHHVGQQFARGRSQREAMTVEAAGDVKAGNRADLGNDGDEAGRRVDGACPCMHDANVGEFRYCTLEILERGFHEASPASDPAHDNVPMVVVQIGCVDLLRSNFSRAREDA
jgi:hypothetical protein